MKLTTLKMIRTSKGLTRLELSNKSGVAVQTIQALEDGLTEPRNAKLSTLLALCFALNIKLSKLFPHEKNIA